MTDPIKIKIREIVPVVIGEYECDCDSCRNIPITLAVVLRAIRINAKDAEESRQRDVAVLVRWNLEQDSYDQQSEECKQFIGSLLN